MGSLRRALMYNEVHYVMKLYPSYTALPVPHTPHHPLCSSACHGDSVAAAVVRMRRWVGGWMGLAV